MTETVPQRSIKHHYLPIFYLRRWATENGVCEYSIPFRDTVKTKMRHPSGTGYVEGLYDLTGLSEELADQFERTFLSPADSDASDALTLLEGDHRNHRWMPKQRSAWSRFLMSLLARMPDDVSSIKRISEVILRENDPELHAQYIALRGEDGPATFADWIEANDPDLFVNAGLRLLMGIIDQEGLGNRFNRMQWATIPVPKAEHELFTSDSPIVTPHPLAHKKYGHLILPIGPRLLFVASPNKGVCESVARVPDTELVGRVNKEVVRTARRIVIATTNTAVEYVQKHMAQDKRLRLIERQEARATSRNSAIAAMRPPSS